MRKDNSINQQLEKVNKKKGGRGDYYREYFMLKQIDVLSDSEQIILLNEAHKRFFYDVSITGFVIIHNHIISLDICFH